MTIDILALARECGKERICTHCHISKPLAAYSFAAKSKGGIATRCRDCARKYYFDNKARISAKQKQYRIAKFEENRLLNKLRSSKYNKDAGAERYVKHREKYQSHREMYRAKEMIRTRIVSGAIIRLPCEICGLVPTHAHHDDYAKPLAIRWLCVRHHRLWHLEHGAAPNGETKKAETA